MEYGYQNKIPAKLLDQNGPLVLILILRAYIPSDNWASEYIPVSYQAQAVIAPGETLTCVETSKDLALVAVSFSFKYLLSPPPA